jgi:hypothetical protein
MYCICNVYWGSHVWPVDVYFCWASGCIEKDMNVVQNCLLGFIWCWPAGCIEKDISIVLPCPLAFISPLDIVEEDIYVLYTYLYTIRMYSVYRKICTGVLMASSLQRHNTENAKQMFPEKELRGLRPNFHIYVSVSD